MDQGGASALVIIDMQRALYSGPSKPHDSDQVLGRIKALIAAARSAKVLVVFVQHCSPKGTPCEKGSKGWELVRGIAPDAEELLVQKTRPSIFFGTDLQNHLRQARVSRLVLVSDAHTTMDSPALPASSIIAHHNLTLGGPFAEVLASNQITFT